MLKGRACAEHWARPSSSPPGAGARSPDRRLAPPANALSPTTPRAGSWLRRVAIAGLLVAAASTALAQDSTGLQSNTATSLANSAPVPTPLSTTRGLELALESESDPDSELDSVEEGESESDQELDDEGGIGIVGGFSGVSSFSPNNSGASLALDSKLSSVVALSQDSAQLLGTFTAEGEITAGCSFYGEDGSAIYSFFGGSITSLNGTTVGYVAGVDANGQVNVMDGGVTGPINALFCDQASQQVFAGGSFTSTVSGMTGGIATRDSDSTGGLAVYSLTEKKWHNLSFHGVDGAVHDFAAMHDDIYAVGEFTSTVDNATHVPLDTQPMNLTACQINGGNSAEIVGFSNPKNTICTLGTESAGNTWLMRDMLTGFFEIVFPFKATPSLLRLMNTRYQGRGTKTFRVEAGENNQVLAMSYLDPETKAGSICTQQCPLAHDYSFQDFHFIDGDVMLANITGVRIIIVEYYGMGGGFNKVELFQKDIRVYSVNRFNGSPCSKMPLNPSAAVTGNWIETKPASYHGTYQTLSVNGADIGSEQTKSAYISLTPYLPEPGFYNVYMSIPGCQNTNTCAQRSTALVTVIMNSKITKNFQVEQKNLEDNEVFITRMYSPQSSNKFSATVYVRLWNGATPQLPATSVELVVDSFRFERDTSFDNLNGVLRIDSNLDSDDKLFGPLYGPLSQSLPNGSVVYTAVTGLANSTKPKDTLFLGGKFEDKAAGIYNIAQYHDNVIQPLNATGIWGTVHSMTYLDSSLYIGGDFNGTADLKIALSNIAQYNTTDEQWYQLSGGTNSPVSSVVPYSPFGPHSVAFSGDFTTLYAGSNYQTQNITSSGLAVWDASVSQWSSMPYIRSKPTLLFADSWQDRANNVALVAGSLSAVAAIEANGAILLSPHGGVKPLSTMGAGLLPDQDGRLIVNSGLWYAKDNTTAPVLIVGGQFQTPDGKSNVARLQDGKWQSLVDGINGEVLTINNAANLLFIGGVANMTATSSSDKLTGFSGLLAYNMDKDDVLGIQSLQGPANSDSSDVRINKVAIRADTSMVVVGGNFTTAGGLLSCPYICTLDINENQWSPLAASTLVDQVSDLLFADKYLVVAGTFKNSTEPTSYLMAYDFELSSWTNITGVDNLPGPVTALTPADHEESAGMYYVVGTSTSGGTPYLAKYDGTTIVNADFTIESQSTIRDILLVPRSRIPNSVLGSTSTLSRRSNMPIPAGYVLAVSGDLHLPSGRRASNAFFYDNQWAAFLSTIQSDGSPGFISSVFFEIPPTNVYQRHRLSVALVILIAIAIALGITFLIVLVGLVYIYLRNRREAAATASAASAALAAATGGVGTTKAPHTATMFGTNTFGGAAGNAGSIAAATGAAAGIVGAGTVAGAAAGAAMAAGTRRGPLDEDRYRDMAGNRDTWGDADYIGEPVSYGNVAANAGRLASGSPAGLAGLAVAGRQAAVSSDTYVHYDEKKSDSKYAHHDDINESLDSIFESAAAEAEAEAEVQARERAASASSMEAAVTSAGVAVAAAASAAAKSSTPAPAALHMPTPRHYNNEANLIDAEPTTADSSQYSRTSMYRPDSTNPFEQRMALRESQGAFPPAGPFADTDSGLGHVPIPRGYYMDSEHATAAALTGASPTAATAAIAASEKPLASNNARSRSESASTRNIDGEVSTSQSPSSRPSGESSANGSLAHLPIRDSLKQYPVFYAKFTFSSRETGELGFRAGERVFVIDQSDEIWWMGIVDHGSDQPLEQGVFPATYVSSDPPKSTDWSELM
ncbi:hypothetical protein GGI07_004020 [Coemansia sp. Benny D115]|nr:hypothetical protein GGI07_004020 [Coemansia sp. Benny D115]